MSVLNEKVEKKITTTGEIKYLYIEKLKQLALTGNLVKQMKSLNKLDFPTNKLNTLYEEVEDLLSFEKLEEIKKMNKGLSQLFNWVIFIFEFNKIVNPFDFISSNYITNRFDTADLELIKYFCEVVNYLKYNLKVKFKFCKAFEFERLFTNLQLFLNSQKINSEKYFIESNSQFAKIVEIYNETKEVSLKYIVINNRKFQLELNLHIMIGFYLNL